MPSHPVPLNETDEAILDEIRDSGRASTALLAKITDKSEPYIRTRVRRMREHDILVEVSPHLYDIDERRDDYSEKGVELEA